MHLIDQPIAGFGPLRARRGRSIADEVSVADVMAGAPPRVSAEITVEDASRTVADQRPAAILAPDGMMATTSGSGPC